MSTDLSLDTLDIVTPEHYEENGYPFPEWAYLREHAPVFRYERENADPFWAVTKHADIIEVSKQPEIFLNEPRLAVFPYAGVDIPENWLRHLLNMDPPDHAAYRRVTSQQFTPRATLRWEEKVERITREVLDEATTDDEIDFVRDVSAKITIAVIAEMLGVPHSDWEKMFRWTNEIIAPGDPEFQRNESVSDTLDQARNEVFEYFDHLVKQRRENPTDDIISVVANGKVNGELLPPVELLSYYFLLVVAGNETTRNAMTGGLLAFLDNPDQWDKLVAAPELMAPAVEEVVRWTTPVIQFCRTATQDYELRGQKIRRDENLCLYYPSANRDEDVFEDGDVFRIDRTPNDHIAFGRGEHVCLGAHLARLELRCTFEALRERMKSCDVAGPVQRVRSSFVGGIKHVPLRWELGPANERQRR